MLPLNEQAYNYLQKLILENHFSYQEVYSETKLSKELGISRTPLRDAVHRLAQEGYIDIIPSKGFMLHQMNRKDVNETFQVRSALETYCTVQICKEFSSRKAKKLFKDLDWIMECMKDIMETTHSIKEFSVPHKNHRLSGKYTVFKCICHVHVPYETSGRTFSCT